MRESVQGRWFGGQVVDAKNCHKSAMLSPDARAGKERIFSTAVRPKIGKIVTLDENFNSGPPIDGTSDEAYVTNFQ
jgi:hypothetical protein